MTRALILAIIAMLMVGGLGWVFYKYITFEKGSLARDVTDGFIDGTIGEAKKMGGTTGGIRSNLWGTGEIRTSNWNSPSCTGGAEDISSNIKALIGAADETRGSSSEVNPDILLALVATETRGSFNHCNRNNLNEVQKSVGGNSWGIGQIEEVTANELCSNLNIMLVEQNSVCAAKVVQAKMALLPNYNERINICQDDNLRQVFLGYDANERLAKAYHGFGCASGADLNYVEIFSRYLREKPWLLHI